MTEIESRYEIPREIETIKIALSFLPPRLATCIEHVWCDSKFGDAYVLTVRNTIRAMAVVEILRRLDRGFTVLVGGHNGINIENREFWDFEVGADWEARV